MSQPQLPSSQAIRDKIQGLIGEITFQKVLLQSLDDTVKDREEAELEIRKEIRDLESQVRQLKRGTTTGTSTLSSSQAASSQAVGPPTRSTSPKKKTKPWDAETTSDAPMDGFLGQERWGSLSSSTASTPNSTDLLGDLVSPSRMNLPSRKRSHSTHLDGGLAPYGENKSRRTSPSPYLTGPTTPSTASSGDEDFEDFEKEYKKQQKLEQERRLQEKADADYARRIQESLQSGPMPPPASSGPSAFDRISGIRPFASASTSFATPSASQSSYSSGTGRPWPQQRTSGSFSSTSGYPDTSFNSHVKSEFNTKSNSGYSPFPQSNRVEAEPSSSKPIVGTFREASSEESDSDIEIIPADAFYQNRTTPRPKLEPKHEPGLLSEAKRFVEQAASKSKDALTMALYGKQSVPNWKYEHGSPSGAAGMSNMNPFRAPHGTAGNYVFSRSGKAHGSDNQFNQSCFDMLPGYSSANMHIPQPGLGYAVDTSGLYGMNQTVGPQAFIKRDPFGDIIGGSAGNNYYQDFSDYLNTGGHMTNQFDYTMAVDPRKTGEEIKALLDNIKSDVDVPLEDREGTPDGMKFPLYEHQKIALTWLKAMETGTNKGGILADDMGLGKTISSLALIMSRPSSDRARKTTLIVGPVALVRQWEQEIRKKIKASHRLSTHLMHGAGRKLTWAEVQGFDIVMTTYGTLAHELKSMEKWIEKQKAENRGEYDQAPMAKKFPLLGPKSFFYRVILDEAQSIKNKNTGAAKAACNLKSTYRLALSGTPMQNNPNELYSLIHFLRIKPYNEWSRFSQEFGCLTKYDKNKRDVDGAMKKLQAVLKAIMLRRTKTSLIDGKPIITLPPKTEEIQHVVFNDDEQDYYKALESKTQIQFNRYVKAGVVGKNYSNILVLLLRLRQACCHPHLIMDYEEAPPAGANLDEDAMIALAKSLSPDVVNRLLEAEAFECPVCYDAAENPRIIVPCGHDTCSECLTKICDQAAQSHAANGNDGNASCKCPSCRGELRMDKILDFVTFKKVHKPEEVAAANDQIISEVESETDDSETESESEDGIDSDGDLRNFIVPDDVDEDEDEIEDGDDEAEASKKKLKSKGKAKKSKSRHREKGKEKEKVKVSHISLAMLKKEASKSAEHRRRYMRYLRKNYQPSAKVDKCVELLERFQNDGQKTIVFSQFVTLLDLVQVPLDAKKLKVLRYDGSMSADSRQDTINTFTDKADHNIMLISLKAGNAGLNLVAASRVIILDPFWNPFIEMQAIDRAYRIGQQKSVEVHRILIEGTVEDRIIELQERKRALVDSALDEGANRELGRLGAAQLAYLFGVGGI